MLTISKLASRAEVTTDAIRHYEREGLVVAAARTAAGYRQYDEDAVRRLRFIKQAQQCGFSLSEIGELLELAGDGTAVMVVSDHGAKKMDGGVCINVGTQLLSMTNCT